MTFGFPAYPGEVLHHKRCGHAWAKIKIRVFDGDFVMPSGYSFTEGQRRGLCVRCQRPIAEPLARADFDVQPELAFRARP